MELSKNTGLVIRYFKPRDARAVQAVVYDALINTNTQDYPQRIIDRMRKRFTADFFIEKATEDAVFVAEYQEVIIGTARLDKNLITNMFVASHAQGQGVGRALTQALEEHAQKKGYRFARLYASLSAIGFYERLGYEQVDVAIHDVFGTNAVMRKSLA